MKKLGIIAGEASGDLLGAALIQALRQQYPDLQIEGIGGPAMQAAGCHSLFDIERLSVMGIIEPLKRLPDLLRLRRDVCKHFLSQRPDVFIGVDAPDFNLGIELKLRQAGIKTVHYVSPSVWAWRQYRVRKIAKAVDLMLALFPFEEAFYAKYNVAAKYVGHPLADQIPLQPDKLAARRALGLSEQGKVIALLPGSRKQEIQYMAEPYLLAAKKLWQKYPDITFITPQINEARSQLFLEFHRKFAPEVPLHSYIRKTSEVLSAADIAIVTSGTATLECMLYKTPMVIAYRMPKLIYKLVRWMITAPYAGLPNLLANKMLVPELIQSEVTTEALANAAFEYLDHPEKMAAVKDEFTALHKTLKTNAAERAAESIAELL
jgi:lipid-A-disaccharide synthase